MPKAAVNGIQLYYESTGEGFPLVLAHEFAGDFRSWEPQARYFSRRYRVITYNARGYPPSDVPTNEDAYSQETHVEDLRGLLEHLGIEKAHICGLSMGGTLALNFGLTYPGMSQSLIIAAAGSGSTDVDAWRENVSRELRAAWKSGEWAFDDRTIRRERRAFSCGARTRAATASSPTSSYRTPVLAPRSHSAACRASARPCSRWKTRCAP